MANENEKIYPNKIIDSLFVKSLELLEINENQIEETTVNKIIFNDCKINHCNLGAIFKKQLIFQNCEINFLNIKNHQTDSFTYPIIFNGGNIKNFTISNAEMKNNLHINHNSQNKLEIVNLNISSCIFEKDFSFHNVIIKNIEIKDCDFNSLSEFINSEFTEKFNFDEITYKGFTLFDNCTFNPKAEFKYIIFEKFTSFRGSKFNKGIDLEYSSSDKEINFYGIEILDKNTTSQETYRIIKNQFEKLNNKIEANKYHALEMELHRKDIWSKEYITFGLLTDGIVSFIHWLSSNHSSNWFLALFWIFVVSFVTNFFLGNNSFDFSVNGWDNIFKYINILSKIEDFNNSYIVMSFNKIFLGYLYYQFVTAVRKDTRK